MTLSSLTAVTPIDGRYYNSTKDLANYFSEFALIKYRVLVEVEYFIALSESGIQQLAHFDGSLNDKLRAIYRNFSEADAQWIKDTEKVTNHDVKAVEYFLKNEFEKLGLTDSLEFIHFGLTSQDINNTAIPLSWKEALTNVYTPAIQELVGELTNLSNEWKEVPMLARTHGQPASQPNWARKSKCLSSVSKNNWSSWRKCLSRRSLAEQQETSTPTMWPTRATTG